MVIYRTCLNIYGSIWKYGSTFSKVIVFKINTKCIFIYSTSNRQNTIFNDIKNTKHLQLNLQNTYNIPIQKIKILL